jgi:hypothetical protein
MRRAAAAFCLLNVAASLGAFASAPAFGDPIMSTPSQQTRRQAQAPQTRHPYIGMWVTADGRIRQELLENGRYDEARGTRAHAYQGRYEVNGSHIDYWDDTGFTADGEFVTMDELHHGGMVFHRER